MTPEQIVEMIGNISNRADLKAVQANQVFYIKGLVREAEARRDKQWEAAIRKACPYSAGYCSGCAALKQMRQIAKEPSRD